jgi:hypothetical protein
LSHPANPLVKPEGADNTFVAKNIQDAKREVTAKI